MKKTIITALLTVASAAAAFADINLSAQNGVYTITGPGTLANNYVATGGDYSTDDGTGNREQFTLTAVFTWSELVPDVTSTASNAVQIHYNGIDNSKTGIGFKKDANGNIIACGMNNNSAYVTSGDINISSLVSGDKLTLTIVMTDAGGTLYGYNANAQGDDRLVQLATSTSWKYGPSGHYNKIWLATPLGEALSLLEVRNTKSDFATVLTISEEAHSAAKLVPEPTTATLSLLALAGLASRRRRK